MIFVGAALGLSLLLSPWYGWSAFRVLELALIAWLVADRVATHESLDALAGMVDRRCHEFNDWARGMERRIEKDPLIPTRGPRAVR